MGIRLVRDQAFKTVELFVKKLEEHAKTMVYSSPCTFFPLTDTSFAAGNSWTRPINAIR